jgi:NitT/TauT family transport system substrate-binding protein
MKQRGISKRRILTVLAVGTLFLSGCSGEPSAVDASGSGAPSGDSGDSGGELTPVVVGTLPVAVSAALLHGEDAGIFEKHGLDLELQSGQAGTALVTAVVSGSVDIGFSSPLSVILASEKGLPVSIISGFSNSNDTGDDTNTVIVRQEEGIESFADLEGKTVAVNAVETQGDLSIMESIEMDGGDPVQVNFLEIPFPEMQAQLANGSVDAVWTPDPFMGRMLAEEEFETIGSSYQASIPGQPTQIVFAGNEFIQNEQDTIEAFRTALAETLTAVENDQSLVRDQLPEYLQMDPAEADRVQLGRFDAVVDTADMEALVDLMAKYGLIENDAVDLDELLREGA